MPENLFQLRYFYQTASGSGPVERKALKGGVETFLTKAIDFAALRTEINARTVAVA